MAKRKRIWYCWMCTFKGTRSQLKKHLKEKHGTTGRIRHQKAMMRFYASKEAPRILAVCKPRTKR